jgi:hypothetical protein
LGTSCSVFLSKYYSGDKIMKSEMDGACGTCAGEESRILVLVGKTEGKSQLVRPGLGRRDDIKMDLKK